VRALFDFDVSYLNRYPIIAGVDEAGRGPIAGPLVVASCVLDYNKTIVGLNDSKKLTEKVRERLFEVIIESAVDYKIVIIDIETIDSLNILGATLKGMRDSVIGLKKVPSLALIDGNKLPNMLPCPAISIIKGDATSASIAAASILAKVTRDRIMMKLHEEYPIYNWNKNKGYPTKEHLRSLELNRITEHHRRSFYPIKGVDSGQTELIF
jgi:ribonuclease HII